MTDAPTILFVIKGLGAGGAERLLVNSIPHLSDEFNYEVATFLRNKTDLVHYFTDAAIPVHVLGSPLLPSAWLRLRCIIRSRGVALIDAHLPVSGVVARIAARGRERPKVLYTEHSLSVQRRFTRLRWLSFLTNVATYRLNDYLVAVSHDTMADVERYAPSSLPRRTVLNGIPIDEFAQVSDSRIATARRALGVPDDHLIVGHVAKMVSKKDQATLLHAARLVLEQRKDISFVLVGKGELRSELERMVHQLSIQANVVFAGFVEDLPATVGAFDMFALSSLHEGLPTVLIEALAAGVPVVATDVGGTSEIVRHGISGLLVPPRRPESFAQAILELANNPDRRSQMAQNGADDVRRRFHISRRVEEITEIYRQLLPGVESTTRVS